MESREVVELTARLVAATTPNPPGDERPAAQVEIPGMLAAPAGGLRLQLGQLD